MTMPQYQRQGFGRFLIDFSYLLSREEGQPGTPEKPLSDLGRVSYHAYWKSVVLDYLYRNRNKPITMQAIANETGLYVPDIALAFQLLHFVRCIKRDGDFKYQILFSINWDKVNAYHERTLKQKNRIYIDPECLRWTPLLTPALHMLKSDSEDESMQVDENNKSTSPDLPLAEVVNKRMRGPRKSKQSQATPTTTPMVPAMATTTTTASPISPTPPANDVKIKKPLGKSRLYYYFSLTQNHFASI